MVKVWCFRKSSCILYKTSQSCTMRVVDLNHTQQLNEYVSCWWIFWVRDMYHSVLTYVCNCGVMKWTRTLQLIFTSVYSIAITDILYGQVYDITEYCTVPSSQMILETLFHTSQILPWTQLSTRRVDLSSPRQSDGCSVVWMLKWQFQKATWYFAPSFKLK